MKFNPHMNSVILALNTNSMRNDIEVISRFYSGRVTILEGFWNNKKERSYQLNYKLTDLTKMQDELALHGQEAYIINTAYLGVYLCKVDTLKAKHLGTIKQIVEREGCCTKCKATGTYWKATL